MAGDRYRLRSSILGIHSDDKQRRTPIALPEGCVVEIAQENVNGNRLVDVKWEGRTIMMFTFDLRNRCEFISPDTPNEEPK